MPTKSMSKAKLVTTGFHLPYNPALIDRARQLRKNMTLAEKKLWYGYLRNFPQRVLRQRPIDNYIVDFYCPSMKLVIEVDGGGHFTEDGREYVSTGHMSWKVTGCGCCGLRTLKS